MEIPLLKDVVIIFALSIGVLLVCHRFYIPAIVGFLVTGVLSGPHGLGLVSDAENVKILSEIGIVFLLFTVGMEFSPKRLFELKRYFFFGGMIQVALTVLCGYLIGFFLGRPWSESLFLGFLISMSSTAITLRILGNQGQLESPQGNLIVGILIFQDIIAIPMMLLTPLLIQEQYTIEWSLLSSIFKGIFLLVAVFLTATYIVPKLLFYITKTRNRELFLVGVLTIGFSVSYFTASLGLSLALGAFLAGLVISESEYTVEAIYHVLPFEEVFISLFFISTGMLLDFSFLVSYAPLVLGAAIGMILLKTLTGTFAALFLKMPLHHGIVAGLSLCQIGEFSFVLAKTGMEAGIGSEFHHQLFLSVVLLTMGLTPLIMSRAHLVADWVVKFPWPEGIKTGRHSFHVSKSKQHQDHLILIGFGFCGRQLSAFADEMKIPTFIIEMNPETVHTMRGKGHSIHYGDASHESILRRAHIMDAKAVVIVINDPFYVGRIVKAIKSIRKDLPIIVRVRYLMQKQVLKDDVSSVVCDELSVSKELVRETFKHFDIPVGEDIEKILEKTGNIGSFHPSFNFSVLI